MYRLAKDMFTLSSDIKTALDKSDVGSKRRELLKRAEEYRQRNEEQWKNYNPQPPLLVRRVQYDAEEDKWEGEEVMVEVDSDPFGRGALRECFRMKEISLEGKGVFAHRATGGSPTKAGTTPGAKSLNSRLSFGTEDEAASPRLSPKATSERSSGFKLRKRSENSNSIDEFGEDNDDGESPPSPKADDDAPVRRCSAESISSAASDTPGKKVGLAGLFMAVTKMEFSSNCRCWVVKRSINDWQELEKHREDCKLDVVMQMVAKRYGEMFNAAVAKRTQEVGKRPLRVHNVDFLMTHLVEFPDGTTMGAESFVFGDYRKHNNNSGHTLSDRLTPQAFSYFSFRHSNRRLMIVDLQGIDDLYTDPVIHFLPRHSPNYGDQSVNLGIRGFALFLWSHRFNEIDRFLQLPQFALALSEQRALGIETAGIKLHELHRTLEKSVITGTVERTQRETIYLEEVPGIDLRPEAFSRERLPAAAGFDAEGPLPLDLVEAGCHMEIAEMYHEGRICEASLLGQAMTTASLHTRHDLEAAVFHLVEAAKQGLPEALLGLARVASEFNHAELLPDVQCQEDHHELVITLLERAAECGMVAAHGMLGRFLSSSEDPEDAKKAIKHLEQFATIVSQAAEEEEAGDEEGPNYLGLDVTSRHMCAFGWDDSHGYEPHSALAQAAEICEAQCAWERAAELWQQASDLAMENPRLAKQAMRFSQRAEEAAAKAEEEGEAQEEPVLPALQQLVIEADPATFATFQAFASNFESSGAALAELLRLVGPRRKKSVHLRLPAGQDIRDISDGGSEASDARSFSAISTMRRPSLAFCKQDTLRMCQRADSVKKVAPVEQYDDDIWGILGGGDCGEEEGDGDGGGDEEPAQAEASAPAPPKDEPIDEDVWAMLG